MKGQLSLCRNVDWLAGLFLQCRPLLSEFGTPRCVLFIPGVDLGENVKYRSIVRRFLQTRFVPRSRRVHFPALVNEIEHGKPRERTFRIRAIGNQVFRGPLHRLNLLQLSIRNEERPIHVQFLAVRLGEFLGRFERGPRRRKVASVYQLRPGVVGFSVRREFFLRERGGIERRKYREQRQSTTSVIHGRLQAQVCRTV